MPRRVVVTGVGVISGLGLDAAAFWRSLAGGLPGIGPLQSPDFAGLRISNGAEVRNYDPAVYFTGKETDFLDRFAQFAVVAAREAVKDSGIEWTPELRERAAIVTGSCVGGQTTEDEGFQNLYLHRKPRVNPLTIPRSMSNA
ncbi:MAG TPA: beta-ketoacyl synthase N-terminal-like domain-containing protein, partial [Bryobacteraceae bacterium]